MLPPALHRRYAFLLLALAPIAQTQAQSTQPQPQPLPLDAMQTLASVFGVIRSDYVTAVDGDRLMAACTKGMFTALDSASAYLDAEDLKALSGRPPAGTVGIGVELVMRAGLPTVAAALEGSPAEKAGLRPRDYLLDIDGRSLEETTLSQALDLLQGKAGTPLVLTLRRPGESAPRKLTLVREPTQLKPVFGRRWGEDLGYLQVRALRENTPADLRTAVQSLLQAGPLKGLVLDLRHAPGGLLQASIEVAAMFLPAQAVITRTEGRQPEARQTFTADRAQVRGSARQPRAPWPDALQTVPLVVLVDGGTASGAEIIAAALRDNGRARLLGSKTFGRGSIQTVRMVSPTTAIKLTTALYRTPGGELLQDRGLQPDEPLPELDQLQRAGTDDDPALPRARRLLGAGPG